MVIAGAVILGIKVDDKDPIFLAALAVHVAAALPCVVCGAGAALSTTGSVRHVHFGRVYYWTLGLVFATATAMAAMRWAEDYHLFAIGSIAFAAGSVGFLHRRRRHPGDAAHITGMGISYIALLTAFYVDNGKNLPLWSHLPHIAYWVLPSAIGLPLITRAVRRAHTPSSARTTPQTVQQQPPRAPSPRARRARRRS